MFDRAIERDLDTEGIREELEQMRDASVGPIRDVTRRGRSVIVTTGRFNLTVEEFIAIQDVIESRTGGFLFGPNVEEVVVRAIEE